MEYALPQGISMIRGYPKDQFPLRLLIHLYKYFLLFVTFCTTVSLGTFQPLRRHCYILTMSCSLPIYSKSTSHQYYYYNKTYETLFPGPRIYVFCHRTSNTACPVGCLLYYTALCARVLAMISPLLWQYYI